MTKSKMLAAALMSESLDNDDKIHAALFAAAFEELDNLRKDLAQIPIDVEKSAKNFDRITTQNVDNFVDVANEALSKFIQKTNTITQALDALKVAQVQQEKENKNEAHKKNEPSSQTWLIPTLIFCFFTAGIIFGVALTLFAQK